MSSQKISLLEKQNEQKDIKIEELLGKIGESEEAGQKKK